MEKEKLTDTAQNKNMVKLGEIAKAFKGCGIAPNDRKEFGDYLIVESQHIRGGQIDFEGCEKAYCDKDCVASAKANRSLLKHGDVLISTVGEISWATYQGIDDNAVAGKDIIIIRGTGKYEAWVKFFFHTKAGTEHLTSQLAIMSRKMSFHKSPLSSIVDLKVPYFPMSDISNRMSEERELEKRVIRMFRELGWNVRTDYGDKRFRFDLALFDGDKLHGVVEVKVYSASRVINDQRIARQLESYKLKVGSAAVYLFVDDALYEYANGSLNQIPGLPRPGMTATAVKEIETELSILQGKLPIRKKVLTEVSLTDQTLLEVTLKYEEIIKSYEREIDELVRMLMKLSSIVIPFQSLVLKQLDLAESNDEEQDRILHAFSQECVERYVKEIRANNSRRERDEIEKKLKESFGESAWGKLEEESKTFLVSAKVSFNRLDGMDDLIDYSGVCLLVVKALEVELSKRLCVNFIAWLGQKYPGESNYYQYPTALIFKKVPVEPEKFTLGSVAHVLCYKEANNLSNDDKKNNRDKLLEYAQDRLLSGKTEQEIFSILDSYAQKIERVREDYRNPAAHTNQLTKIKAKECFDLVIDVNKLLKNMLDAFDE